MSMGADRAIQLKADKIPSDGLAVAKALAAELKDGGYDLVLFGKHAFDTSAGVVGTATAELLGMPCVTAATKLEISNGRGLARRELEGAAEMVEFPLPAAVSLAQDHHGGEEKAARDEAGAARRRPRDGHRDGAASRPAAGPHHRRRRRRRSRVDSFAADGSQGSLTFTCHPEP